MKRSVGLAVAALALCGCASQPSPHSAAVREAPRVASPEATDVPPPTKLPEATDVPPSSASPSAASLPGFRVRQEDWFALTTAYGGVMYGIRVSDELPRTVTLWALDATGHRRSAVIADGEIADYFHSLAVGPTGVYASTAVITKFSRIPDEVLRIDPQSLRVTARRQLATAFGVTVAGPDVFLRSALEIQRVDPSTLVTVASVERRSPLNPPMGGIGYWAMTVGGGRLWAAYGDAVHSDITTFDPTTLRRLSGVWPVPPGQGLALVGTPAGAWLAGVGTARLLLPSGGTGPSASVPQLPSGAVADGDDLLVLGDGTAATLLDVHTDGSSRPLPNPHAECGQLVTDGTTAWMHCDDNDLVSFALPSTGKP